MTWPLDRPACEDLHQLAIPVRGQTSHQHGGNAHVLFALGRARSLPEEIAAGCVAVQGADPAEWLDPALRAHGQAVEQRGRGQSPHRRMAHDLGRGQLLYPAQREDLLPITGTTSTVHLEENAAAVDVELPTDDIERLSAAFDPALVAGDRMPAYAMEKLQK